MRYLCHFAILFLFSNCCFAQLRDVPKYPLTAVAEFKTGGWSKIESHEGPKVLKRSFPQIVIFAKTTDEGVFRLAKEVDKLVSAKDWGKWCALVVCHQNNPTPSKPEWDQHLANLGTHASKHRLDSISIGLWKRLPESSGVTRAHRRFDGFNDHDVVIFYRNKKHVTQYLERLAIDKLDEGTLKRVSHQLEGLIAEDDGTAEETAN